MPHALKFEEMTPEKLRELHDATVRMKTNAHPPNLGPEAQACIDVITPQVIATDAELTAINDALNVGSDGWLITLRAAAADAWKRATEVARTRPDTDLTPLLDDYAAQALKGKS